MISPTKPKPKIVLSKAVLSRILFGCTFQAMAIYLKIHVTEPISGVCDFRELNP